ncbi:MAG: flagellar basal body-associated FliL family protein [Desulfocapsaceae bacterium]|jgi:flagellar FliL protein|nr:flagellar basal body-associated FliL family protein [Desulfocapsaceae bacterium]
MMAEKSSKTSDTSENSGSKKKLFIVIGIVVLLLLIAGGVAGYFLLMKEPPPEEKDPGMEVPVPEINTQAEIGPMVNIEEFIVNIISDENNHYVKASLTIELSSEPSKEEIEKRMPQIRDAILLLVGNKTFEELQDLQGKKQLKAELLSKINAILQTGQARSIYFTDFVVQ